MKLTDVVKIGRFKNKETGKQANIFKGKASGGWDVRFYIYRQQRKVIASSEWERVSELPRVSQGRKPLPFWIPLNGPMIPLDDLRNQILNNHIGAKVAEDGDHIKVMPTSLKDTEKARHFVLGYLAASSYLG